MANQLTTKVITDVHSRILSHAMALNVFENVAGHEPKNAPGSGMTAALWTDYLGPAVGSGLQSTSALLVLNFRIYTPFRQEPVDSIDPTVSGAMSEFFAAVTADFDLLQSNNIRCIDLLGMTGRMLSAQAGYIEIDRKLTRVMTGTIPIIFNDSWPQSG